MFCVFKMKKIGGMFLLVTGILFIVLSVTLNLKDKGIQVFNDDFEPTYAIVIDAGHGEPDGGAVSKSGVSEVGLNLDIALMLKDELEKLGYNIIMTRTNENNIADKDKQTPLRKMKVSDINNRIKIINESQADMLVSIHMNNFQNPKYYGWQTFYKKNSEASKVIAENIQAGISNNIDRENDRVALSITDIKLIDKSNIPAVIVECGFLSNEEDLRLLLTDEYKQQIVAGIVDGIEMFYRN